MNQAAERHLAKAEGFLAKGDSWYAKAADEIIAAQESDPTLSYTEIGNRFGRSKEWARKVVAWRTTGTAPTPFAEPSRDTPDLRGTKRMLREAPLEQVEQILSELPADRQRAIGAAAGHAYLGARQEHEEREGRLTPAERQARKANEAEGRAAVAQAMGGWNVFGIVSSLGHATEVLREMIEEHSIKEEHINHIETATEEFLGELRVARAMAGLDPDRETA